jgi:hypothetical protein
MVAGIDKGIGLRLLAADLGVDDGGKGQPLALAVGDTVSDLPVFDLAVRAFAPANADAHVRSAGVTVLPRPYQSGLALAASHLLGHPPGRCPICRGPRLSRDAHLLLTVLAAQETGTWGMVRQALLLAARVWTQTDGRWSASRGGTLMRIVPVQRRTAERSGRAVDARLRGLVKHFIGFTDA